MHPCKAACWSAEKSGCSETQLKLTSPSHQLLLRRAAQQTVCRVQCCLQPGQAGAFIVAAKGEGAASYVQLAALACGAQYVSLERAQDATQLWTLLAQVTECCRSSTWPTKLLTLRDSRDCRDA